MRSAARPDSFADWLHGRSERDAGGDGNTLLLAAQPIRAQGRGGGRGQGRWCGRGRG